MSDPVRGAARAQMRQIIEQAIDSLPEGLRLVFVLREVEQCSVLETAQTLGIHPTTVKTRLFRARRRLRKNLEYRLAPSLGDSFPFLGSRCAGLTEAVMHAIGQLDQTLHGDR